MHSSDDRGDMFTILRRGDATTARRYSEDRQTATAGVVSPFEKHICKVKNTFAKPVRSVGKTKTTAKKSELRATMAPGGDGDGDSVLLVNPKDR